MKYINASPSPINLNGNYRFGRDQEPRRRQTLQVTNKVLAHHRAETSNSCNVIRGIPCLPCGLGLGAYEIKEERKSEAQCRHVSLQ